MSQKKTVDSGSLTSAMLSIEELSLRVLEGPHAGKIVALDKELVRVGREDWCDLSLPDDSWSSALHCELWLEEEGVRVRDLRSRNGVCVDGVRVFDARIDTKSRLQVGQSVLQLESHHQTREVPILFHDETGTLVGRSQAMRKILPLLSRLGQRNVTTLLLGETGTGKTSIAKAIHQQSLDPDAPFVVVNCGALPSGLIETALFGHEKGSFTGADKAHTGFFQQAHGGTLFLDEIAELPLELQPKLLDVLERRKIRKIGSEQESEVDFRLICATHRNLRQEYKAGRFREDLYFRISVVELEIPPLRDRREDIPLLCEAFLRDLHPSHPLFLSSQAQQRLESHLWPGNVRELRNVLERSITFLEGETIEADDLVLPELDEVQPKQLPSLTRVQQLSHTKPQHQELQGQLPLLPLADHDPPISLKEVLQGVERSLIDQALEESDRKVTEAARLLSLSESWLYSRIKSYKLKTRRKRKS